jgi:chemotaxis protein MotB
LQEEFVGVMTKLQANFLDIEGKISVEGHTDNIDISTALFASNWALSSARALSVGHELLKGDLLRRDRFIISGYADTVPVVDNITAEGRAINRRVEIVIRQPVSKDVSAGLMAIDGEDPQLLELLDGQSI